MEADCQEGKHGCAPEAANECSHCGHKAPGPAHKWTCPGVPTACPHQRWGCSTIVPRQDLQLHLTTCAFEPLKPYLEANHARLTSIERRQALLEAENLELKAQLARMTDDPLSPISLLLSPTEVFRNQIRRMSLHGQSELRHVASTSSFEPTPGVREPLSQPFTPLVSSVLTSQPPTISVRRDSSISLSSVAESEALPRSDSAASLPPPRPERHADRPRSRPVSEHRMSRPAQPSAPASAESASPSVLRRPQSHQDWVLDRLPPPGSRPSREAQQCIRAAILHLATALDAAEQRNAL
ncbi:hypothetical protein A1Q2_02628 [Trichosporon asahii var. asahii CBS 8904]|uniref:TRAF-type domain-containing protein n=1 Tax=Trichosporon asahii var. asahii (strain CBS 8904) TaxID=1220162 RepID=K1WQ78_TRIAC|nr:hypothetical protein A1Q2_02628 [Trichosporon asahii var. asahii CBS 8904]